MSRNNDRIRLDSTGSSGSDFGSVWQNELFVLGNGLSGSVDEFKKAAREAVEHPGPTAVKVGTAALIGGAVGFCAGRAGVLGLLARGAVTALGTQFVLDGLVPLGSAALGGLSAKNSRELNRASHELSVGLGRMGFDTLISLPFAMGGCLAGRGLRSSMYGAVETTAKVEAAVASETKATPRRETGSHTGGSTRSTFADARTRRVVLEGEVIDAERVATSTFRGRQQPEIIDAEFTVVETTPSVSRRSLMHSPSLRLDRPALPDTLSETVALITRESAAVPARTSASTSLEVQVPVELRTPQRTTPSPVQVRKAMEAYSPPSPEPGQILNIKV